MYVATERMEQEEEEEEEEMVRGVSYQLHSIQFSNIPSFYRAIFFCLTM